MIFNKGGETEFVAQKERFMKENVSFRTKKMFFFINCDDILFLALIITS